METTTTPAPLRTAGPEPLLQTNKAKWRKLAPLEIVILLAAVTLATVSWNSRESGRIEQITDDACVRADLTPLSIKVAGIVEEMNVSDFPQVRKGELLVKLEQLIDQLHDPSSVNYHQWLTAEQIGRQFGPVQQDIGTVAHWLQLHGFEIDVVYPNASEIDISGTAARERNTFLRSASERASRPMRGAFHWLWSNTLFRS